MGLDLVGIHVNSEIGNKISILAFLIGISQGVTQVGGEGLGRCWFQVDLDLVVETMIFSDNDRISS